ncbi:16S rRNA (cytosine(1402)-N(4))-methyltransferase RsmH [Candidatus Saccharibacteria bacterium]|nr:16S rRNA (cytosine(1402)-N(4))-methyltransferase RsmH [Candidatus Saccharibacteria bacterium]
MENLHTPVLLSEVLASLAPRAGESYLDLTAGYGGHAEKILDVTRNYKASTLVDRDEFAAEYLKQKFAGHPELEIINQDFYNSVLQLLQCGRTYDMILADFGVSSLQLDRADRGFSFKNPGPLDMRMDRREALTADKVVNHWPRRDLSNILVKYGEYSTGRAEMLARLITENRPIKDTAELAKIIANHSGHSHTHPATRVFQAIRIAVNDELGQIERTLPLLPKLLNPGGRLALITFHSLEDRLVKDFYKSAASLGEESELVVMTKKPITADQMELVINPRARSAKLRVAKRAN